MYYHVYSQLSIQKIMGGGRPAGGLHGNTRDTPSCTTIAFIFSFDHKGDPALKDKQIDKQKQVEDVRIVANVVRGSRVKNKTGDCDWVWKQEKFKRWSSLPLAYLKLKTIEKKTWLEKWNEYEGRDIGHLG